MELLTFKTLWGCASGLAAACEQAGADGFDGVEGQIPGDAPLCEQLAETLQDRGLHYIAEICTAGGYVPDRIASVEIHLQDLRIQLQRLSLLKPVLVNCIGGCDRWDLQSSLRFFGEAQELADRFGVTIAFETHRGRSLYSPWVTEKILEKLPLPLTCDFSHWCVVCEGLGDSEADLLQQVARHALHIHARVGYDQGPQVPDPASPLYRAELEKHLQWWTWIWASQAEQQFPFTTVTPEFGPDGYQQVDPVSGTPLGDLRAMNRWVGQQVRDRFQSFQLGSLPFRAANENR